MVGINYGIEPEKLCVYVPKDCLCSGIKPGGWSNTKVVPAFDPSVISPEEIRKSFGFSLEERVLVEITGDSKTHFKPRMTGPDRSYHGIFASQDYVPKNDMRVYLESPVMNTQEQEIYKSMEKPA